MRIRHGLLIAAVLLASCKTSPVVTVPKVVTQTVTKYIPVPAELTEHCPKAIPTSRTVEEAVSIARRRGASLDNCNEQLDKIRTLPAPQQHSGTDQLPL